MAGGSALESIVKKVAVFPQSVGYSHSQIHNINVVSSILLTSAIYTLTRLSIFDGLVTPTRRFLLYEENSTQLHVEALLTLVCVGFQTSDTHTGPLRIKNQAIRNTKTQQSEPYKGEDGRMGGVESRRRKLRS